MITRFQLWFSSAAAGGRHESPGGGPMSLETVHSPSLPGSLASRDYLAPCVRTPGSATPRARVIRGTVREDR